MHIEWIKLKGYRNFLDSHINLRENCLIIGANDVGKTNLLHALRILLDRSLPDAALDPSETDFHVNIETGIQVPTCEILVKFTNIDMDAVRAALKEAVSDDDNTFLRYIAKRNTLDRKLYIGASESLLQEIAGRHYLKYMNLRFIKSQRDLASFVLTEKKNLLRLSKDERSEAAAAEDDITLSQVGESLSKINQDVRSLNYVQKATAAVNQELRDLSHHHRDYEVRLEAGAIQTSQFIEKLELAGTTGGNRVGLGGDGRNNQILLALWRAKSEREQDPDNEFIVYCIEEPESHLHPHQQRKLAAYLVTKLRGQVIVTSHSPQITAEFRPDSVVRLMEKTGSSVAANLGCSVCIEEEWLRMGHRMSVLPAEAFFSDAVLLVEGPSEVLFYHELARQTGVDLDRLNISILAVNGADFSAYVRILDAMEVPWALRTDNDVFKVPKSTPPLRRLAGLNRGRCLAGEPEYDNIGKEFLEDDLESRWRETSALTNPKGIFISRVDFEYDLVAALPSECSAFFGYEKQAEIVAFIQARKVIRIGTFLVKHGQTLKRLRADELAEPLHHCIQLIRSES